MTTDVTADEIESNPETAVRIDGESDLEEFVASNRVVLADFYAGWCGPCKMLEPVVEALAAGTDAAVAKIDVDANQPLAASYGVRGVPTMVLFADGEPAETIVGVHGEDRLRELIAEYAG